MMHDHGKYARVAAALALAAFCIPCTVLARAKRGEKPEAAAPGDRIEVIGHVSLIDASISSITTSNHWQRNYIELNDFAHKTMTVVDVTDPNRPVVVNKFTVPATFRAPAVEAMVGDTALIRNGRAAEPNLPGTVAIVNLSDPSHPATERTFDNVSALKTAPGGLIYLVDTTGLWVLKNILLPTNS